MASVSVISAVSTKPTDLSGKEATCASNLMVKLSHLTQWFSSYRSTRQESQSLPGNKLSWNNDSVILAGKDQSCSPLYPKCNFTLPGVKCSQEFYSGKQTTQNKKFLMVYCINVPHLTHH